MGAIVGWRLVAMELLRVVAALYSVVGLPGALTSVGYVGAGVLAYFVW